MIEIIKLNINTSKGQEFIDLTQRIRKEISPLEIMEGDIKIFCPHTTAGLTINENADPDVQRDILSTLEKLVPVKGDYKHFEGNSHAHLKASLMGFNEEIIITDGKLLLGTWQGVYFCEFDGPRHRHVYLRVSSQDDR